MLSQFFLRLCTVFFSKHVQLVVEFYREGTVLAKVKALVEGPMEL